jgi:cation diffusion facilitator family transporter
VTDHAERSEPAERLEPAERSEPADESTGGKGDSGGNAGNGDDSMRTIIIALLVNLAVAVIKAIAGVLSASAGLLAEAAHSVGDCTTELFLVTAVRRSDRPRDKRHPFGYGKERYFWSLLAALTIFMIGAGFSFYQGLHTILFGEDDTGSPWVGYVVIALSAVVEGVSLRQAGGRARRESRKLSMSLPDYVRDPDDPTVKSVILEDSAAMVGLTFALLGLLLRQLTGETAWDGVAALCVGGLLVAVAFELARTNVGLLIGKQANPKSVGAIRDLLADQPEVMSVVDVVTMMMGTGRMLVCARVDFVDEISATEAEHACIRFHGLLHERIAGIQDVFIEPIPQDNRRIQDRARETRI